jgi:hypothetical protein
MRITGCHPTARMCRQSAGDHKPRSVSTTTRIVGGTAGASVASNWATWRIHAPVPGPSYGTTHQATGMAAPR